MTESSRRQSDEPARVYVDDAFLAGDWGFWTGGGHLQADTLEALHEFAAQLGLKREWFQSRPGRPDRDHYDLTRAKRDEAIARGAIPETVREGTTRRRALRADALASAPVNEQQLHGGQPEVDRGGHE